MPDATAAAPADKPHKLDDVMIAMDVVDMIRHRDDLVRRELNDDAREAELIERLREIYRQQGIEVSDKVLAEGVKALKESRFTYTPKPPSMHRTMLEVWAGRSRYGKIAALIFGVAFLGYASHYFVVTRPAEIAREEARIEISERLPQAIRKGYADIVKTATDPAIKPRADELLADGERAIRDKDRDAMQKVADEIGQLDEQVRAEYTLTIVSRPGEQTGVWRRPPRNATQRNFYLIVEAIAPDGRKLKLPVRNEETGATETVDKFGVRVPQATYDAVGNDKRDDGIVQRNRFGVKRRGTLEVDYQMPFDGGTITKW